MHSLRYKQKRTIEGAVQCDYWAGTNAAMFLYTQKIERGIADGAGRGVSESGSAATQRGWVRGNR